MTGNQKLRNAGLKITFPRITILTMLESAGLKGQHVSVEDLHGYLSEAGEDIGLATVYRVLAQFEQAGLVVRHYFETGRSIYELAQSEHHDHMVCSASGDVIEFTDSVIENRQQKIAEMHGYELVDHSLVLYVRKKDS